MLKTSNSHLKLKLLLALTTITTALISCGPTPPPTPNTRVDTNAATTDTPSIVLEQKDGNSQVPTDSVSTPISMPAHTLFIGRLGKLEDGSGYHVPIYLKEEMKGNAIPALYNQPYETISVTENEKRSSVPIELLNKYFLTEGLQELWVFNQAFEVIDSLKLQGFEYLEQSTSSSFVATYTSHGKKLEQLTAITKTLSSLYHLKTPSPRFESDSSLLKHALERNKLAADHISYFGHTHVEKDLYLLASFSNYEAHKDAVYLFKNGLPVDSITKKYYLQDLRALPISTKSSGFYTANGGIPETDAFWCQLIEIEWHTGKLILHERNRMQMP